MQVKHVLVIEGTINLLVAMCKLAVGTTTGSTAIIADACHSISDVFNNIIAYWAHKISNQPADASHPYGHRKFEQLAIFALASFLVFIAFELILTAIENFGEPVTQSYFGLAILIVSLMLNVFLALWEGYWAKTLGSDLLVADAGHTAVDVLTSISVLVGWQLAASGYYWVDTLFTIIVSMIIWYLAFKLFQRAIPILVDQSIHDHQDVLNLIKDIPNVRRVTRIRSRTDGSVRCADIVVSVETGLTNEQSHQIADQIETVLHETLNMNEVLVHIEPFGSESTSQK